MKRTLNIGMIGYNFMGKAHSNAWRQAGRFFDLPATIHLHTICGRNAAAVQEAAERYGWQKTATDWRTVVADPEIDIIDISTPTDSHHPIALAAIRAGKAVLCEKPLAMNLAECEEIVAAAKEAGTIQMICHNYRRIPAIALARKMIEDGVLGERIYHFRARYAQDWIADPEFPLVWRLQSEIAGLGTLGCIGSHIIDLGRYLVGEIREVSGLMETFIKERPVLEETLAGLGAKAGAKKGPVTVEDTASWIARFENGAVGNFEATRFAYGRKNQITLEINGSKGSLAFDFEDMNRLHYYNAQDPEGLRGFRDILVTEGSHPYLDAWWPPGHLIGYEHTFTNAFADFARAVVEGHSVQPTLEDGLENERVISAIVESARCHRWVALR